MTWISPLTLKSFLKAPTCSSRPSLSASHLSSAVAEPRLHHAVAAVQAGIQSHQLLDIDVDYAGYGRAYLGRRGPEVLPRGLGYCGSVRGVVVVVVVSAGR